MKYVGTPMLFTVGNFLIFGGVPVLLLLLDFCQQSSKAKSTNWLVKATQDRAKTPGP